MPTKFKGTPIQTTALNTYIALMRTSETLTARIHEHLKDHNLTVRQFAVLEALYHLGTMRQNDLAEKMLCTPGNITGVIDTLEEMGLVTRQGESGDRRCKQLLATTAGKKLIKKIMPKHVAQVVTAFSGLSCEEQCLLTEFCKRLH